MQLRDDTLIKLAREIAIDHLDSQGIQELYKLSEDEWQIIQRSKRFQILLESEIIAWQSAQNTSERTKLKAGAIVENWLPEANTRLHDKAETLNSKVELAKLITSISGMTKTDAPGVGGSGFSVTINLGNQPALQFNKELPVPVIEHQSNGEGHK